MISAVLFDYDGVLVNSMPFHVQAWQAIFRDYDIELQPEEVLLREGSRAIELASEVLAERNTRVSDDELLNLVEKKQNEYRQITDARIENGSEAFLARLKNQGLALGLVTGTERRNVEHSLDSGFTRLFDTIITNDETDKGKPNPECYLNAANALAVAPEDCLVIENAPLGIQAAKSAGMKVVALMTTLDKRHLPDADFYASDIQELQATWDNLFVQL